MTQKGAPMPFEKSVVVPLTADETFALITKPDRLRRWQVITARVDLRAGGDYRWTIVPGHSVGGTITEVEPGKRVVFTWGWEGSVDLPPGSSTVIITLEPAADGTRVRLVHEGLTDEQAASHGEGWNHYLGRLVRAATDGDAGADDWAALAEFDPLTSAEATLAACQLVLRGIPEADYHRPTPCTEFDVRTLVGHIVFATRRLAKAAGDEQARLIDGEIIVRAEIRRRRRARSLLGSSDRGLHRNQIYTRGQRFACCGRCVRY